MSKVKVKLEKEQKRKKKFIDDECGVTDDVADDDDDEDEEVEEEDDGADNDNDDETCRASESLKPKRQKIRDGTAEYLGTLNEKQKQAVSYALEGHSLFITGGAGVGKSYCLRGIVKTLADAGRKVALTATTGIAAVTIGGVTIHSFSGLGRAEQSDHEIQRIGLSVKARSHWNALDVLIIDEISMMCPSFFVKLDMLCRVARNAQEPFGGLQCIFVGDFFQLPPVRQQQKQHQPSKTTKKTAAAAAAQDSQVQFCFETSQWNRAVRRIVILDEVFRQKDAAFADLLNRCRVGALDRHDLDVLYSRLNKPLADDGIEPTFLHAYRSKVDALNAEKLDELRSEEHTFSLQKGFYMKANKNDYDQMVPARCHRVEEASEYISAKAASKLGTLLQHLCKNNPVGAQVCLKVGAQVMLTVNLAPDLELVNGSRGVVESFLPASPHYPVVRFANDRRVIIRPYVWRIDINQNSYGWVAQIPLTLGYAFTIHKSQSQSMDRVCIELSKTIFEHGQAYVALSRVRCLEGLTLSAFSHEAITANPRVLKFYQWLEQSQEKAAAQRNEGGGVEKYGDVVNEEEDEDD